jgi:FtsP/CotA-like multicopper oxidase with cupredoxin domain
MLLLLPLNTLWLLLLLLHAVTFLFTAGDIMTVNGKPWPYHKVEKRTYRFNVVNAGAYTEPLNSHC